MAEPIRFHYIFKLAGGVTKEFELLLDAETLALQGKGALTAPDWTELSFHQCPNCPLDPKTHPHCPVALNLSEVTEIFKSSVSFEPVELTIKSERRTYHKQTSLQQGLSALMGIYMTTSGCPILDKLRPMARHHLPFSNAEETQYRVLSMYLLAQYFLSKKGKAPDWEMKKLPRIYEEIRIVNRALSERFKSIQGQDSIPNAVVILDTLANSVTFTLETEMMEKLERLFAPYWEEAGR